IGWLAIGGHLQFSMRMIGAFVAPLATLILLIQFFVTPSGTAVPEGSASTILRSAHIALAVVGMAFGIIACAVSILFLWQQNLLKKKLLDQLPRTIPAIDKLDRHLTITLW